MKNILISIILTIGFLLPIVLGTLIFKWKKKIIYIYFAIFANMMLIFFVIYISILIFYPSQEFEHKEFESVYSEIFKTKLPINKKYIATKYQQGKGLLPCRYWTARIITDEKFYYDFQNELQNETGLLKELNVKDEVTSELISQKLISRYMSGYNFEIEFFNDNKTIRVYIIDCP